MITVSLCMIVKNEEKVLKRCLDSIADLMDEIIIVLQDVGPGIKDIDKAMQAGYSTASDQIRSLGFGAGMGLPNMKKYSDDMKIETTLGVGTTVTLVIKLQPQSHV